MASQINYKEKIIWNKSTSQALPKVKCIYI